MFFEDSCFPLVILFGWSYSFFSGSAINSVDDKAVIAEIESHEIRNVGSLG